MTDRYFENNYTDYHDEIYLISNDQVCYLVFISYFKKIILFYYLVNSRNKWKYNSLD
jgi:hypothetical protein